MSVPPLLGPYRIGELIGRGGMGNVYAAEHHTTGHRVAVKLISTHVADEPRFRRRFEKEIHALKLLKHPGIVRLIGYGEENGQLFYSMELVEGETLQKRIRRESRLSANETIDISIKICAALKHAHDIGIQHRDLKPANLMLTRDDQIKLVDFGIPKNYWDSAEETVAGSVLGTPDYMAPEQADDGVITGRTDLYALGSVMYAMLAGRSPFKGKNATAVIESLRRDKPVPLNMVASDAPEELCDLVHHLLQKVPGDRPPTALVVSNRLKAMKAGLQSRATESDVDSLTNNGGIAIGSSDSGTSSSKNNGGIVSSSGGTKASSNKAKTGNITNPSDKTVVAVNDKTHLGQASIPSGVGSDNPTQLSQSPSGEGEETSTTRTHFETVDHSQPTTSLLRPGNMVQHGSSKYAAVGTAAAITILLAIVGWAIKIAMTPPTADQLYQSVIEKDDIDAAEAFLIRYADDERVAEVNDFRMQHRVRATLNRLKATKKIGLKELGAAETSFLSAMSERSTSPAQARENLLQWSAAFGDAVEGNPAFPLVELADYEAKRLADMDVHVNVDPRAFELLEEIETAIAMDNPDSTEAKLEAIIATFSSEPWASPAMKEAQQWLDLNRVQAEVE